MGNHGIIPFKRAEIEIWGNKKIERRDSPVLVERRFFLGQAVAAAVIYTADWRGILARSDV